MSDNDVDLRDVFDGFQDVRQLLKRHGRDVFTEAKRAIKADMRDQKRNRRSATGVPWAPRAASSRERAQRGGKKRRKSASTGLLGKIPTAWSSRVDEGGLEMRNRVSFAAAHHEGATVGRGAKLPARPHLDINPQRVADVVEAFELLALDTWNKRR